MQTTNLLIATLRDAPADVEVISHKLMLRSGMIRQLAAGIYTWLPLGLRVLRKVEHIIREEMNHTGAQEILMSAMQPAELWQESGRWTEYGPELLRISDRHQRQFCFGPTHEEVVTDLVRREIRSYKQLPANFYQIQTKIRDEIRPRFGIMRAREFIMKDAYSFHLTDESLEDTYQQMYKTYCQIFDRLGLHYRAVIADSGNIGGEKSHEFHVLADSGEDQIVYTEDGDYAANIELVDLDEQQTERPAASKKMEKVATSRQHTIEQVCNFLKVAPSECVKTLVVYGTDDKLVSLVLRGDHELNRVKAERLAMVLKPLKFASSDDVRKATECDIGSLGPVDSKIPIIVDHSASVLADFVCGANLPEFHLTGVNWERDLPKPLCADLRAITEGESPANGSGPVKIARGIEVGHIFQLGTKYSEALNATCLDEKGKSVTLIMGCYGIGVTRIVAAAIEQNHDARGIIWPLSIAPYTLAIVPINMHKSKRLRDAVMTLYSSLIESGIEVLLDDRRKRPGVMFADIELIGIPHRIVFSEKGLDSGTLEYKGRRDTDSVDIPLEGVVEYIKSKIN